MKRIITISLLILITASFSSCFQVLEDITLAPDGSGNYKLTLNMSESRSNVAAILQAGRVNGHKVPSENEMQKELSELAGLLRRQSGISSVNGHLDFRNYIGTLTLHFRNINNLNQVITSINRKYQLRIAIPSTYTYNSATGTFIRTYHYSDAIKNEYNKMGRDRQVLNGATYTCLYHFPKPVITVGNRGAQTAKNKLAVMQRTLMTDLVTGRATFTNRIQLAK